MANWITAFRFVLLFVLVVMVYELSPPWQLLNAPLLVLIFALDGIDGYVARKRGEESLFGSVFDIAVDRVVENVLWLVAVHLGFVPVWVGIVFLVRGFLVDAVRAQGLQRGETPFAMLHTALGRWLVAGRFMRFAYGAAKMLAFGWILLIQPWPQVFPELWGAHGALLLDIQDALVLIAVLLCLARGLPVIAEFAISELIAPARTVR
ncbi:CDP-alcohol phosphatidyltransferase family protein [Pelomicrobium sp.]|jgi:CDP-diacylglycerol--glycerol-3-phosphate 3-phosphatidyltransferase|uniref:CDP-alcohol phosphatidyltransferase family protein n=1 Tax=Pelomicrobium sp. TaxID=2815319 RepID=UPI002FDC9ECF